MRVLFWSHAFWPELGGVQRFGAGLIRDLKMRGFEFCVVTEQTVPSMRRSDSLNGVPIHRFPFRDVLSTGRIDDVAEVRKEVIDLKRSFAPELIHLNAVGPETFFHHTTINVNPVPTLLTLHGLVPGQDPEKHSIIGRTIEAADWTACCSNATLDEATRYVPTIASHANVIYAGLQPAAVKPRPLPRTNPILLCLGRLSPEKGFDIAVNAFSKIAHRFPSARLSIAGDGRDKEALQRQSAQLGLDERVDFLGWVAPDRVPELMNTAAVVLMPSRWEGFGLVALEAALMARPVVAAAVGGLQEIIQHEVTGVLVPGDDSAALAEAVAHQLSDLDAAEALGQAAKMRAVTAFRWEDTVDSYATLYHELATEGRHRETRPSSASDRVEPKTTGRPQGLPSKRS